MEHFILGLALRFIQWLNERSQKSLSEVTVDYPALIRDPDHALRDHPIHIGRARRFGSVLAGTLLVWMVAWLLSCGLFLAEMERKPAPGGARPAAILVLALWVATPLASWFAVKRYLAARAGTAYLTRDGVTLSCRNEIIFCPWELFATTGKPVRTGQDRVLVPVAPEEVAGIVIERDGNIDHSGNIRTRPLTYKSGDQVALKQLYLVDVAEMAAFFLHVGQLTPVRRIKHSADRATAMEADHVSDDAKQEANGWITVYVSRLAFATQCCGCGQPTTGRKVIRASTPILKQSTDNAGLALSVPVCSTCARRAKRRSWARLILGSLMAAFLLLALTVLTCILVTVAPRFGMFAIVPTILVPIVFGVWAVSRSRRMAAPVEARRWLPSSGTVQLRFQYPEYSGALVAGRSRSD
jgi:hypothetical protein